MNQATAVAEAPKTRAHLRRAGWRVIARKEFVDHVVSVRFTILILIMGLATIAAVYAAAGGIREVASTTGDFPALFLKLFTVSPERVPPMFAMVGLLGPLLGIAFAFDAINGERAQGTLPRLLAQPIYRDDVINGKFVAGISVIGIILLSLTMVVGGIGMLRIGVVPSPAEITRLLVWVAVSIVYIGFWLALSLLLSVGLRRAATSALAAIAAWLVISLFAGLLIGIIADAVAPVPENPTPDEIIRNARIEQNISRIFPPTLYQQATIALLEPERRTFDILGALLLAAEPRDLPSALSLEQSLLIVWPQVTALIALTILCFAAAYVLFMRQEVRA